MKNGIAGVIIVLILLFSSAANSLALDPAWKSVVRGGESYLGSRGFLWNGIVTEGGDRHYHLGVDIIASEGEEIYPIASGEVVAIRTGEAGGTGNSVMVYHEQLGLYTIYLHMRDIPAVDVADSVTTETVLGYVGSTGFSTGPHVHFEIRLFSTWFNPNSLSCSTDNPNIYACWSSVEDEDGNLKSWIYSDYKNPETYIIEDSNIDVALIIDSSGSMTSNDRQNLRKAAAKIFVHNADDDDQIAIVDFDSSARIHWALQPLTANRDGILSAIDKIDSSGGTNLGAGLLAGYNQLKASTEPNKKAAVFMTDGQGSYSNQAQLYLNDIDNPNDDWPVYTIGLGSGVNKTILQNIADTTGGIYFALSDPNQLQNVYFEIANLIRVNGQPLLNTITVMFVGSTYCTWVDVPTNQESVTFLISWPGSEVSASLISPSGRGITPDTTDPDVYHAKGPTYELYRISNPEAGQWDINLYGVDLDPNGEEVRVSVSSVGPPAPSDTTPPVISISSPLNGKTYFNQLPTDFHFIVEDPESLIISQSALLNGNPINNNDSIILTQLGENTLTVTATNEANLTSEETVRFYVNQFFWLRPIRYLAGSSTETATYIVKANSTLPIKFANFDEHNVFVPNTAVKVLVEGTTAEFVYGDTDADIRINQEEGEEPNYIVNLHTNFNKWDYQMEIDGEYWIKVYFDDILAAKTKIKLK